MGKKTNDELDEVVTNTDWMSFFKTFIQAKKIVGSVLLSIAAIIGAYEVFVNTYVTRVYADDLVVNVKKELRREFKSKMDELQEQTKSIDHTLVEMRMIRIEGKIQRGETLTPTEQRVYDKLKRRYEAIE